MDKGELHNAYIIFPKCLKKRISVLAAPNLILKKKLKENTENIRGTGRDSYMSRTVTSSVNSVNVCLTH